MSEKAQYTELNGHRLKLTNLDKVLYPGKGLVKAEIIQYYLQIASLFLKHNAGRPLSFIRFPDGIEGKSFYSKDKPEWAPDFIQSTMLGEEDPKNYVLASNEASLVWIANLACLEIHQMGVKKPKFVYSDYFVFDLDPSPETSFKAIVNLASELGNFLRQKAYHPMVKTSGSRGLHIFCPIHPEHTQDKVVEKVKKLAKEFVSFFPDLATIKIRKDQREGKTLLDINRNHRSQTCISPYSLRAKPGAPVSMPLHWSDLAALESSMQFNIKNASAFIEKGDPWENFHLQATPLESASLDPKEADRVKKKLEKYNSLRNFNRTNEPQVVIPLNFQTRFVIQRHDATNLHYDLRLEKDGVLESWAIPKGLPMQTGVKRLAIRTEPHPVNYLHFEGKIPKNEYGGGQIWIYDKGKYQVHKWSKEKIDFSLEGKHIRSRYRIIHTKDKQALVERLEERKWDIFEHIKKPMLAGLSTELPEGRDYQYEIKWDGIRAMIYIQSGKVKIYSRNLRDISSQFPELLEVDDHLKVNSAIFDGEIVCLDENGSPQFNHIISRLHCAKDKVASEMQRKPVHFYLFDGLYLDGRWIIDEPLVKRQQWVESSIKHGGPFRISEALEDGKAMFEAGRKLGLEGIMVKKKESRYFPGKRSESWLKVKYRQTADCRIVGYTQGKGERSALFGSLHIVEMIDGEEEIYRGKVGTGFDFKRMKQILHYLEKEEKIDDPPGQVPDEKGSIWLNSELYCEIEFASTTPNDTFREPVFIKLKVK